MSALSPLPGRLRYEEPSHDVVRSRLGYYVLGTVVLSLLTLGGGWYAMTRLCRSHTHANEEFLVIARLVDAETGSPLPGVSVVTVKFARNLDARDLEIDGHYVHGDATDADGCVAFLSEMYVTRYRNGFGNETGRDYSIRTAS